ncbi:hypothetical protein XELAEV_18001052mg [Xenopus laevis]|nr:hypothetical protein XELAEV_18001052mg [Xenopus laevis]
MFCAFHGGSCTRDCEWREVQKRWSAQSLRGYGRDTSRGSERNCRRQLPFSLSSTTTCLCGARGRGKQRHFPRY